MRVICVSDKWTSSSRAAILPKPAIGDIDIVVKEESVFGATFYDLERFPDSLFHCEMFATLPDADEPAEVEEKEKVNLQPA